MNPIPLLSRVTLDKGSKRVEIAGLDDKCQLTVLVVYELTSCIHCCNDSIYSTLYVVRMCSI